MSDTFENLDKAFNVDSAIEKAEETTKEIKKVTSETKKNVQLENLKKIKIVQDTTKVSRTKQEETTAISPLETLNFD